MSVEAYGGLKLAETNCISCGQCTLFCPVGAITEQGESQAVLAKLAAAKVAIAQVDPSLSANFAEAVGLPAGTMTTGKIVSALKQIGFSKVYSTAVGFDLFGLEEAANLLDHIGSGAATPLFSSYCGAWKTYVAKSSPSLAAAISKTPAPAALVSNLAAQPGAFSVAVTSCIGKKAGLPKADAVVTARELAQILRLRGVNFATLPDTPFDAPYASGYANAGAGGIADLVLRTAAGESSPLSFAAVDGLQGVKTASVRIAGKSVAAAVVEGAANIAPFVAALAAGKLPSVAYVEVQACPGGCAAGGGGPKITGPQAIAARLAAAASLSTATPIASKTVGNIKADTIAALGLSKARAFFGARSK
jgi:iron only hydrogenase large subunit-like protein